MRHALGSSLLRFALMSLILAGGREATADLINFEDLTFAPGEDAWYGPDPNGSTVSGPYGPQIDGSFRSGGASFVNRYDLTYGTWDGFAYSRVNDTTHGFPNQFGAITGTGHGGSGNYGVGFGADALTPNLADPTPFDPSSLADLKALPNFSLAAGSMIEGMYVTNTTYAYLSMTQGDAFGTTPFGGPSGNDPDYLLLTAYGTTASGEILKTSVDFYLADYQSSDPGARYIVDDWRYMDLSGLKGATSIYFNISGSKNGLYGLNTPTFFALDDIRFSTAVPEPSSAILCLSGLGLAGMILRSRRSRAANLQGDR
ncbi:DUF4465 domain-containing protein [Tundrisphaera lichenicola]|uniref:DUF4465 domain-containing protein n=1 Tax=Tundrisphaera lichenicola TaxID=2029860 RepID=UPI003EBD01D5